MANVSFDCRVESLRRKKTIDYRDLAIRRGLKIITNSNRRFALWRSFSGKRALSGVSS